MGKGQTDGRLHDLSGADARIEGTLVFEDAVHLDGSVKGYILSENGMLSIGKTAHVEAEIQVADVKVMGEVKG